MKTAVRQAEPLLPPMSLDDAIPAVQPALRVDDVVVAQAFVDGQQRGGVLARDLPRLGHGHRPRGVVESVVVRDPRFAVAAFQAGREIVRGVGGTLLPEQVERHAVVEVDEALQRRQIDGARGAHPFRVVGAEFVHHCARPFDDPHDAGLAHEHVMGFLGQHELAGTRQRVEAGLGQGRELIFSVAVGEEGEHEVGQPVWRGFVESAQNARFVRVAGVPLQHHLRLFATVAPEVGVQQIDHRPQVAALLHVDLEQIAQVVQRRAGGAQMPLLFDRGRLGITLRDDQPAQLAAVLAGHLLPGGLPEVIAEGDARVRGRRRQEDAPTIVGHFDVAEMRPAVGVHADCGAQIDVQRTARHRSEIVPPAQVIGLPGFQGAPQPAIVGQPDVVRNALGVIDRHGVLPV